MLTSPSRTVAALLTVGALTLAAPSAAAVTVSPSWAEPGSDARLAFTVLNEQRYSSIERLEVTLPAEYPIHDGDASDKDGWELSLTWAPASGSAEDDEDERLATVVWSAEDDEDAIAPGEAAAFVMELAGLPETGSLVFRAMTTYSDGDTESWDAEPREGEPIPDRPAPVLLISSSTPTVPFAAAPDPVETERVSSETALGEEVVEEDSASDEEATADVAEATDDADVAEATDDADVEQAAADSQQRNATLGLALGIALILLGAAATAALQRRAGRGAAEPAA